MAIRGRTPYSASHLANWGGEEAAPLGAARTAMLWLLAAIYVGVGLFHVLKPASFLPIMPPVIPFPGPVVMFTGACEIAGGVGLLIPPLRRAAAAMLALYALCVWPANVYHALWGVHVPGLPDSWWYHGPRLAFQPVLIWWPLFAARVIDWPRLGR
jgi:uncharacterized membrane protein